MSKDKDYHASDQSSVWPQLDDGARQKIVDDYHQAGKTIRISLFGSEDYPLTYKGDPTIIAQKAADFVKQNNLDGVDVDYEDTGSFNQNGDGENFLITLTQELRKALPSPQYLISHAPQSPYFASNDMYPQGAYLKVHKEVGDQIDFYNVQFYNQGDGAYDSCDGLYNNSPEWAPDTTVSGIIKSGIPAEKVIIGKLGEASDGGNGYMSPSDIGSCISQQNTKPGGVMAWEWIHAGPDWIKAAKGDL
ncbi:glycoside hydrolase [Exidia glandulosa HHB12029]|uniref:chitinase n=1 Tax=Exidia glandulosa HHB12029 TaxID=1314781 RepID=A0A165BU41_EXIGL|nr:glycoside hydrolase [Exidia glandulosa HHB12029]